MTDSHRTSSRWITAQSGSARVPIALLRPGAAEIALTVLDEFQRQGIGGIMLRHLVALARAAGLSTLIAEVLPDNTAMLRVFERSGLQQQRRRDGGVIHVTLDLG